MHQDILPYFSLSSNIDRYTAFCQSLLNKRISVKSWRCTALYLYWKIALCTSGFNCVKVNSEETVIATNNCFLWLIYMILRPQNMLTSQSPRLCIQYSLLVLPSHCMPGTLPSQGNLYRSGAHVFLCLYSPMDSDCAPETTLHYFIYITAIVSWLVISFS